MNRHYVNSEETPAFNQLLAQFYIQFRMENDSAGVKGTLGLIRRALNTK